jgi:SAM-dependent methyltransferase
VADAIFENPRLASVYDPLDPDRSDLDLYLGLADLFGAKSVLDIGCGTGTFACTLAERGIEVTGVDPAGASLDVARRKPGADKVRWIHGDVTALPSLQVDMATMTANVAQVFVTDEEWLATLRAAHDALRPGGHLVFETRDPAREAWRGWTREQTYQRVELPSVGWVQSWHDLGDVRGDLVSFGSTVVFESDGEDVTSDSTLRFRGREEITAQLRTTGFTVDEVLDAPDRPGREFVFVAGRKPLPLPAAVDAGHPTVVPLRSPLGMVLSSFSAVNNSFALVLFHSTVSPTEVT